MKNLNLVKFLVLPLCIIFNNFWTTNSEGITISDNGGYEGIVIEINSKIKEDPQLITNLQILITDASKVLFEATKTYFKSVVIIVPNEWKNNGSYKYYSQSIKHHIRIDDPNPLYGDSPYTLQVGECGQQGEYIHITPEFIKKLNDETTQLYGPPGKQLVHEWAHFRYGVFDEYGIEGDTKFPPFYLEDGMVKPSSCIMDIQGWIAPPQGFQKCRIFDNGIVDPNCRFVPDIDKTDAEASLMFMPYIKSITKFCDSEVRENSNTYHNKYAPTKHNILCNYRSTWDIISNHNDIKMSKEKSKLLQTVPNTTITVTQIAQKNTSYTVLVMDVSGSMRGLRFNHLQNAVQIYIEDFMPDGSNLGMVTFGSFITKISDITTINSTTRPQLVDKVRKIEIFGETPIGKGLKMAETMLTDKLKNPFGSQIILITDGEENSFNPSMLEETKILAAKGIRIDVIGVGNETDKQLENVALLTGGKSFLFSIPQTTDKVDYAPAIQKALLGSVTTQTDVDLQPITLVNRIIAINQNITSYVHYIWIDKALGKNAMFSIAVANMLLIDVEFRDPNNKLQATNNLNLDSRKSVTLKLENAIEGNWSVIINRKNNGNNAKLLVSIFATSEPTNNANDQPVRVRSWMDNIQVSYPSSAKIFAEVRKGYNSIINADVVATVNRPDYHAVSLTLLDNGIGADLIKDDGIYSAYFTKFNGDGKYAVSARVVNNGSNAQIKIGSIGSSAIKVVTLANKEKEINSTNAFGVTNFVRAENFVNDQIYSYNKAESFDREVDAEMPLMVSNYKNKPNVRQPIHVTDLIVKYTDYANKTATLQWTIPNNNDDNNNSMSYQMDLRISNTRNIVTETEFNNAIKVNVNSQFDSISKPVINGLLQTTTVKVPDSVWNQSIAQIQTDNKIVNVTDVYFALKSFQNPTDISQISNIASAHFGYSKAVSEGDGRIDNNNGKNGNTVKIVVIVIGTLVGVVFNCNHCFSI